MEKTLAALIILSLLAILPAGTIAGAEAAGYLETRSCAFHIVAVSTTGEGVLGNLTVTIAYPGTGKVYISTSPASMIDTQGSARIAAFAASLLAGVDMTNYDFFYDLESESIIIGGPSAGSAMALATLYLLLGKDCPGDVVITGMIQPDTSIGPVGGLKEKLEAAASGGARLFIVPAGQEVYTYYVTKYQRRGPIVQVVREPVTVNLTEYGEELGVRVVEAASLLEAYEEASNQTLFEAVDARTEIPAWMASRLNSFVASVNETVPELLVGASDVDSQYIEAVASNATELMEQALAHAEKGRAYLAAVTAVRALAYAANAAYAVEAVRNDYNVTGIIVEVNETLRESMENAAHASAHANTSLEVEAIVKAWAKLGIASYYFQLALSSLVEEDGSYYLPVDFFGRADPTAIEYLAHSWALAKWSNFWTSLSMDAPDSPQVDKMRIATVSKLLVAQARTTVAYVETLLQEARGNTGAANLPAYMADMAMASDDPLAAIGLSIESMAESTVAIHESFTLAPWKTATELESIASYYASLESGIGVQPVLLTSIAQETNDTVQKLLASSRAILYAWTLMELTTTPSTSPTTTPTQTTTHTAETPGAETTTQGHSPSTTEAEQGLGARGGIALAVAAVGVAGILLGLMIGMSVRKE